MRPRDVEVPALILMGIAGAALAYVAFRYYADAGVLVGDGHAYWLTGQDGFRAYQIAPDHRDAYLYSPAFAQAIGPLTRLPWPVFAGLWVGLEAAAFLWLLRPLGWPWALVLLLWCTPELVIGNVLGFVGVAVVLGLGRWPGTWVLPVLTKPAFGVGLVWFAVRREWRRLAIAVGVTVVVMAVSLLANPTMWADWWRFLLASAQADANLLTVRIVVAAGLVGFAALKDRAWLVPVALLLATPVFAGSPSLTILAAVPRLLPAMRTRGSQDAG